MIMVIYDIIIVVMNYVRQQLERDRHTLLFLFPDFVGVGSVPM